MKYKKTDKIIQELLSIDTNFLLLSDEKLVEYIDYIITDSQILLLFGRSSIKNTDNTESLILNNIKNFIEDLTIHFDENKNKEYTPNVQGKYKELDCEGYITFLHRLIF